MRVCFQVRFYPMKLSYTNSGGSGEIISGVGNFGAASKLDYQQVHGKSQRRQTGRPLFHEDDAFLLSDFLEGRVIQLLSSYTNSQIWS